MTVEEALKRAYESRSDFQAALADVRAAEYSRRAAAGGLPAHVFVQRQITAWRATIPNARRTACSTCAAR